MDSRAFLGLQPSHNPYRWWLPVGPGLVTGAASCSAGAASARPSRRWRAPAGAPVRVGHRAVPVVRQARRGDGHRRHDRRRGAPDHPGPGRRATSATARSSPSTPRSATGRSAPSGQWEHDARRAAAARVPAAARPRTGRRRTVDQRAPRPAAGPRAAIRDARRHARRRPGAAVGAHARACIEASTRRRWRSSATSCRWASARRSATLAAATASTTRCASAGSCRPSGCCSTSRSTPWQRGFGHGLVHLFAEDGTLLATASQSCIVRVLEAERRRPAPADRAVDRKDDPMTCPSAPA